MYLHSDFEYSKEPESPEDRETEGSGLWLEVCPDDLEDRTGDDKAVEAVEGRLEVDAWSQSPHSQKHLENKQPEEDVLHNVCKEKRTC